MWSWIEQLKEPLLTKNDVDVLAKNNTDFQEAFKLLEKVNNIWVSSHFLVNNRFLLLS